jgi:hypothetical protein
MMVVDKNGVEIKPGQIVLVHQLEGVRKAIVGTPFPDAPTTNESGHWVDVNINNAGLEGIPSYLLEVVPHNDGNMIDLTASSSARNVMEVDLFAEAVKINKLADQLKAAGFNASNSTLVAVSSDYSSIAWQVLRHQLSFAGEICEGFTVDVPYPDQKWDESFAVPILNACLKHKFKLNLILIEAGVIRGSNYRNLVDLLGRSHPVQRVVTATLFENTHSKFKSMFVAEYYDDTVSDLTFWWEVYNKHWK